MRFTILLSLATCLAACEGAAPMDAPDMAAPPDLEPPPPDMTPPPRGATDHPAPADVTYGHGRLLKSPELVTVVWGQDPLGDERARFADWIATSDYMVLLGEYGIGAATHKGLVRLDEAPPTSITDVQLGALLRKHMKDGSLPLPSPETLYLVYLPNGTASSTIDGSKGCRDYDGYHSVFSTGGQGTTSYAAYALMAPCAVGDGQLDADTTTASHEIAEAATDTVGNGYNDPTMPLSEIGDLCTPLDATYDATFSDGQTRTYTVNRLWSAKIAAAGNDDPCVPKPAAPYAWFGAGMDPVSVELVRDQPNGSGQIDFYMEPFAFGAVGKISWEIVMGPSRGVTFSKMHGQGLAGSTQVVTVRATSLAQSGTYPVWIMAHAAGYDTTWWGALTID